MSWKSLVCMIAFSWVEMTLSISAMRSWIAFTVSADIFIFSSTTWCTNSPMMSLARFTFSGLRWRASFPSSMI